jgi:hypothetical protein
MSWANFSKTHLASAGEEGFDEGEAPQEEGHRRVRPATRRHGQDQVRVRLQLETY